MIVRSFFSIFYRASSLDLHRGANEFFAAIGIPLELHAWHLVDGPQFDRPAVVEDRAAFGNLRGFDQILRSDQQIAADRIRSITERRDLPSLGA